MRYFNDICCICLSSKIDLRDLHVTDKDGVTYYEILVACIPEMFEFLEANQSYRQICLSCCSIVDVVFKLYQNYLRSKTILLEHIKKLHETVANSEDIPSTKLTTTIKIEENEIKAEIIDLDEDSSDNVNDVKIENDEEEINSVNNPEDVSDLPNDDETDYPENKSDIPDTNLKDDDDEAMLCEPVVILEEMSNDASDLNEHLEPLEEPPPEEPIEPNWDLTCIACHKKFPNKTNLLKHQKSYCSWKEVRRPRGRPPKTNNTNDLTCKVCNREFRYLNALRVHERLHTGELPYECEICKKRFRQISNYNYHMVKHHGKKVTGNYKKKQKTDQIDNKEENNDSSENDA